jgi:hypothetical protein
MELRRALQDQETVDRPGYTPECTPHALKLAVSKAHISELPDGILLFTPHPPSSTNVQLSDSFSTVPCLIHLLNQVYYGFEVHGPYTIYIETTVFSLAPLARNPAENVTKK